MATLSIQTPPPADTIAETRATFDSVISFVSKTVADTSRRVYAQTFAAWRAWCADNGLQPMDITPGNVWNFLADGDTTKATRQRQLSAMRKFAQILAILDGGEGRKLYEGLKIIKAPAPDKARAAELGRAKRALSPAQVDKILRLWPGDTLIEMRNRAMIAVLFFCGLRRSEIVNLAWRDINFEQATLTVRDGKGGRDAEDVAIIGGPDGYAVRALARWRDAQARIEPRQFVFCTVFKGGKLGSDAPTQAQTVYRVVAAAAAASGIDFKPHDARRTHITEFLYAGGTMPGAQAQARHAHASTTINEYGKAVAAAERHNEVRGFRFG